MRRLLDYPSPGRFKSNSVEKIQVGLRVLSRIGIFLYYLVGFLIAAFRIHLFVKNPIERKKRFSKNASYYNAIACRAFGIEIRVKNKPADDAPGLLVGNHMGFVDILVMCSLSPSLFVTSQDMRETPFLGLMTEMGGCLYVDRKSRLNILKELHEMVHYLKQGFRVVIYPEATSHNGEEILPFKRTLLTSAAHAGVPIRPYVFNFIELSGEAFTLKNRDCVCWYGDISFAKSLFNLFTLKSIVCEVEFLDPVFPQVDDDRAVVADSVRAQIVEKFRPVQADLN